MKSSVWTRFRTRINWALVQTEEYFVSVSLRLDRVDIYNGADFSLLKHPRAEGAGMWRSMRIPLAFDLAGLQRVGGLRSENADDEMENAGGDHAGGHLVTPDDKYVLIGITGADYT